MTNKTAELTQPFYFSLYGYIKRHQAGHVLPDVIIIYKN